MESPIAEINIELQRLQLFPDCEVREIVDKTDVAMWGDCYNNLFPLRKLYEFLQILRSQHPSVEDRAVVAIAHSFADNDIDVYYKDGEFFYRVYEEKIS